MRARAKSSFGRGSHTPALMGLFPFCQLNKHPFAAKSRVDCWTVEQPFFEPPQSSGASGFEKFLFQNDDDDDIKSHTPDSNQKNEWLITSLEQKGKKKSASGQCGRFVVSHPWKGRAK